LPEQTDRAKTRKRPSREAREINEERLQPLVEELKGMKDDEAGKTGAALTRSRLLSVGGKA